MEHTESSFTGVGAIPIVYDVWLPEALPAC